MVAKCFPSETFIVLSKAKGSTSIPTCVSMKLSSEPKLMKVDSRMELLCMERVPGKIISDRELLEATEVVLLTSVASVTDGLFLFGRVEQVQTQCPDKPQFKYRFPLRRHCYSSCTNLVRLTCMSSSKSEGGTLKFIDWTSKTIAREMGRSGDAIWVVAHTVFCLSLSLCVCVCASLLSSYQCGHKINSFKFFGCITPG